jgi:hypothetical protein
MSGLSPVRFTGEQPIRPVSYVSKTILERLVVVTTEVCQVFSHQAASVQISIYNIYGTKRKNCLSGAAKRSAQHFRTICFVLTGRRGCGVFASPPQNPKTSEPSSGGDQSYTTHKAGAAGVANRKDPIPAISLQSVQSRIHRRLEKSQ